MRLNELQHRLHELRDAGFLASERRGPTRVGHTLEQWLGVSENNLPIPDIGGRTEIKATRRDANNLITLFTFNKAVWSRPLADIIRRWGYVDTARDRPALYGTVSAVEPNTQGLQLSLPCADTVAIVHAETGETLASWDLFHIVGKFVTKFERLLLVRADSRRVGRAEEFHYNEAHLLMEPTSQTFRLGFLSGKALIDIRMHHPDGRAVRNHGTAFRVREDDLPSLFGRIDSLMGSP